MATKQQEREALAKIKTIVEELGEDSHIGNAFIGVLEDAKQNIENDWACSNYDRWQKGVKMVIRTNDDLRLAYAMLRWLQAVKADDVEAQEKEVKRMKRRIRDYLHPRSEVEEWRKSHKLIKDDQDAYTELVKLPEHIETREDAAQYFDDWEYHHCQPSQYDCTGQLFTAWYKIVKRSDGFYAYHRVCMDV